MLRFRSISVESRLKEVFSLETLTALNRHSPKMSLWKSAKKLPMMKTTTKLKFWKRAGPAKTSLQPRLEQRKARKASIWRAMSSQSTIIQAMGILGEMIPLIRRKAGIICLPVSWMSKMYWPKKQKLRKKRSLKFKRWRRDESECAHWYSSPELRMTRCLIRRITKRRWSRRSTSRA